MRIKSIIKGILKNENQQNIESIKSQTQNNYYSYTGYMKY